MRFLFALALLALIGLNIWTNQDVLWLRAHTTECADR